MENLPQYELSLHKADQHEDVSSLAITHNLNMTEISEYINAIVAYLQLADIGGSEVNIDAIIASMKKSVILLAGMSDGQNIDFNGYRLSRIGAPAGYPKAVEFRITDTDVTRNTDFRKTFVKVEDYAGFVVHPVISNDRTYISIIFSNSGDVASTGVEQSTDANNKQITLL